MLQKGPKFRVFNTEWFDVKILGRSHELATHPMSRGGRRRRRLEYHLPWGLLAHVVVIVEKWFSKCFEWKEMLGGGGGEQEVNQSTNAFYALDFLDNMSLTLEIR